MKHSTLVTGAILTSIALAAYGARRSASWHVDPQVAVGEWKIEMQTPPCDSVHNLQVIWPKESGAPLTIECNEMPVAEKDSGN